MSHTKQTKTERETGEKLGRKRYERELARLQGELVRLQGTIGRASLDGTGVNQRFITDPNLPFGVAVDCRDTAVVSMAGTSSLSASRAV